MIFLLKSILLIFEILLFIPVGIIGIFLVYRELVGFVGAERFLELLHVPLSLGQILTVEFVLMALLFICLVVRARLP